MAPAPYPLPLGQVGEISFWAPNRGLLITGGTVPAGSVPAGLYAYDGEEWHELSTVCGGGKGRIAWAGPDEFWTISDQRAGQIEAREEGNLTSLSLCHFLDGNVVGSYAMPLGQSDSYLQMDAATCLSPDDCWFGGEDGRAPNGGSFHLHWNGSSVSAVYDTDDHAVTGMTAFEGKIYEGLAIGPEDSYQAGEERQHPAVIRTIASSESSAFCEGVESTFCNVFLFSHEQLPSYAAGVAPDALGGFDLATDGAPLGTEASQLWAAADPVSSGAGSHAQVTILHEGEGGNWTQLAPLADGDSPLPSHAELGGSETDGETSQATSAGDALAPEPGTSSAWLSLRGMPGDAADVALLGAPQEESEASHVVVTEVPEAEERERLGFRGEAGPISCPAENDCWMATTQGWLFHLGGEYPQDTDPNFAHLITYRPPDAGVPVIYPDAPPVDDSLANQQPAVEPSAPATQTPPVRATAKKPKQLVSHVKSKFLHDRVLVISFTLSADAHVQLVGREKSKVVASTRRKLLRPGHHELSLTLNPAHWPTKLQFKATPLVTEATGEGSTGSNSSDTITTG